MERYRSLRWRVAILQNYRKPIEEARHGSAAFGTPHNVPASFGCRFFRIVLTRILPWTRHFHPALSGTSRQYDVIGIRVTAVNRQRPFQHHLQRCAGWQANILSAREEHLGQAYRSAGCAANSGSLDISAYYSAYNRASRSGLGDCPCVFTLLAVGLHGAFFVAYVFIGGARYVVQTSRKLDGVSAGIDQGVEVEQHFGAAFHAACTPDLRDAALDVGSGGNH